MTTTAPLHGHEVRLKARPLGLPEPENFELVAVSVPSPAPGQVIVRNSYFLVSASLRQMISEGAEDVPGVPFPALRPGDALMGEALGEVIAAAWGCGLKPGDMVQHPFGWRDYARVPISQCHRIKGSFPAPVGTLGHLGHGWTAYAALTRGVEIVEGDTVFVSSAAGAMGSMAGQIARLLGAKRVIGSTSTREKADRLVAELGYDAAIFRENKKPLAAQLVEAAPLGIDVALDNVGGEQLQSAVAAANVGAQILVVGALSGQLARTGTGRVAPVQLDSMQILLKKLTIRGYSADDDPDAVDEWAQRFGAWLEAGRIHFPVTVIDGLALAPTALRDTSNGVYLGSVFVKP